MPLLGGLAVFETEAGSDLLPSRPGGAGFGDEIVFMPVQMAARVLDGCKPGQGIVHDDGAGRGQRIVDLEERDGIERIDNSGRGGRAGHVNDRLTFQGWSRLADGCCGAVMR